MFYAVRDAGGTSLCGGWRSFGMHISSARSSLAVRIPRIGRLSVPLGGARLCVCVCVCLYTELKDIKTEAQVA